MIFAALNIVTKNGVEQYSQLFLCRICKTSFCRFIIKFCNYFPCGFRRHKSNDPKTIMIYRLMADLSALFFIELEARTL